jgi:UDP-N-acetylmuramoyl-tripeptide--D-alanyl-D-alanine ligase
VHKGKITQTARIVKPKIGILAGINQQHSGVFGGWRKIIDGKFELLQSLPKDGVAILNFNNSLVRDGFDAKKDQISAQKIIFAGKDIFASDIKANAENLSFTLNYQNQKIAIGTNAKGAWMADTILLAVAGALAAGMKLSDIVQIINQTDFVPFNIKIKSTKVSPMQTYIGDTYVNLTIIDSTYSANPDGVIAHLDYLNLWEGKKAVIMPCLIELGKESKNIHFEIGKKIGEVCDLAIIAAKDRFGEIKRARLPPVCRREILSSAIIQKKSASF